MRGSRSNNYDCEDIGAKNTECTLGLCDDGIEASQDGVYRTKGHVCPHDRRFFAPDGQQISKTGDASHGCFYDCHIFQGNKRARELAGQRIRAVVAKVKGGATRPTRITRRLTNGANGSISPFISRRYGKYGRPPATTMPRK